MFDKLDVKEHLKDSYYIEKFGEKEWKKRLEYYNSLMDAEKDLALKAIADAGKLEAIVKEQVLHISVFKDQFELYVGLNSKGSCLTVNSTDIREFIGVMKHAFKTIQITNFGSWIYDFNNTEYYKDEFDSSKEMLPIVSIDLDFSYTHVDGGSNGAKFANASYTLQDGWKVVLYEDRYKD